MYKPTKETNSKPEWMHPTRKLSEEKHQQLQNALRGYINHRKTEARS